ncbi:amidohydrolase family protein [Actinomadura sp. NEAU-AAG7]|uniref:amidohydrolase family protein n=1 Tax=Actinomadura sp. NEAU-AAG7 TaxID=2839640 RepID=UPI001BE4CE84|nr:amidohydrolase family protein [Actinomadura sp. NEAU-AAG7]MBT2212851.1 amidohydrolase family protein [Actinomadura sp. NEAU-AAG7]
MLRNAALTTAFGAALAVTLLAPAADAAPSPDCFDRHKSPYTSVVDSHLHFQPFGGPAVPFTEMLGYLDRTGVRYANMYGIGQTLPAASTCTYYLNCPGTPVTPSLRNDFVNAANYAAFKPKTPRLTLSMTFPDLANPEGIVDRIKLLDQEYPGMFTWMGEVNLIKQALLPNKHDPADMKDIGRWAPFMKILRERSIPLTLHSDLGSDAEPTKYLPLMREVLRRYPNNKIVWAHMGLSKELKTMPAEQHIETVEQLVEAHPNLTLDISWRVLYDQYFKDPANRKLYVEFFNRHPTRVIPGTDFVASRDKNFEVYKEELEITSDVNKDLDDEAFRDIALGQNYFRLLSIKDEAPEIC